MSATSRGRYVRPDRNGGDLRPTVTCDACHRTGHVAANCDILAIALFIEKYRKDLPNDTKDRIELEWLVRWKDSLRNPGWKPRRVMWAYLDLMDMSVDSWINRFAGIAGRRMTGRRSLRRLLD